MGTPDRCGQGLAARGRPTQVADYARWTLELGAATAESPIGRYAAALALLALGRWADARQVGGVVARPRRLSARRRRCARIHRGARRGWVLRGGGVRRDVVRDARASSSKMLRSPTRRSSWRRSRAAVTSTSRCRLRRCCRPDQSVSPCAIVGWNATRDRLLRMRLVLELGQLLDELVEQAAHRVGVELRVHLRAAELAGFRVEVEAALQLAQLGRLQPRWRDRPRESPGRP